MPTETRTRSVVKAITWQGIGILTMTILAYLVTGDISTSGGLAVLGAITGFVCFILHERVWAHIPWGRSEKL